MKRNALKKLIAIGCVLSFAALGSACSFVDIFKNKHEHEMKYVPASESTCEDNGVLEHWYCTICEKDFSDAEGTNELKTTVAPLLPHDMVFHEGTEATCISLGERDYYTCTQCNQNFADERGTNYLRPEELKIGKKSHTTEHREERASTCTEDGEKEHYYCSGCQKKYQYSAGLVELSDDELRIPAAHSFASKWSSDSNQHWHEVLCSHKELLEKKDHVFNGQTCTVCGYHKPSEGLIYEINADGETASLTEKGTCTDTAVYILDVYEGKPVTDIADGVFKNCHNLKSVSMPSSVKRIGEEAFSGCSGLMLATIPSGVTEIGEYAFSSCSGLTTMRVPSGVTALGDYAFSGCSGLKNIFISSGVTTIGEYAFYYCTNVESVFIPNSVTEIGKGAFQNCSSLETLSGGGGVTTIGDHAFELCERLTDFTLQSVKEIGMLAFSMCLKLESLVLPDSVTCINQDAFYKCSGITSVKFGKNLETIGKGAFEGCEKLASITFETNCKITTIGDRAFFGCTALEKFICPIGLESIGTQAFASCDNMKSLYIPNTVMVIKQYAFTSVSLKIYTSMNGQREGWEAHWTVSLKITYNYHGPEVVGPNGY